MGFRAIKRISPEFKRCVHFHLSHIRLWNSATTSSIYKRGQLSICMPNLNNAKFAYQTQYETRWIFYNYKNELQIVYSNADETNKSIRSQHSNAPIYLCFYIASLGKYIVLMVLRCSDIVSSGCPFFHSSGVTVRGGRSTEPNRTGLGVC